MLASTFVTLHKVDRETGNNIAVFLLVWSSCWSSLLVGADDLTTHPTEVNALREIKGSLIDVHNSLTGTEVTRASRSGPEFCATIQQWRMAIYILVNCIRVWVYRERGPSRDCIFDFMLNNITGSIPRQIENMKSLRLLLLSGNQLMGTLPEELGDLPNLQDTN
ncbi:hypothetical protein ACOSP7_021614 [Xanthoceras sorbifolium]